MSKANVAHLIEAAEAFTRFAESPATPDGSALESFLGAFDPEIRFEPQQSALQGGYSGREGVARWLADLAEVYVAGRLRLDDVRDLGDRVLGLGTLGFTTVGSGIEFEAPVAVVATFQDGLVTSFIDYGDHARGLEAVGLSE